VEEQAVRNPWQTPYDDNRIASNDEPQYDQPHVKKTTGIGETPKGQIHKNHFSGLDGFNRGTARSQHFNENTPSNSLTCKRGQTSAKNTSLMSGIFVDMAKEIGRQWQLLDDTFGSKYHARAAQTKQDLSHCRRELFED